MAPSPLPLRAMDTTSQPKRRNGASLSLSSSSLKTLKAKSVRGLENYAVASCVFLFFFWGGGSGCWGGLGGRLLGCPVWKHYKTTNTFGMPLEQKLWQKRQKRTLQKDRLASPSKGSRADELRCEIKRSARKQVHAKPRGKESAGFVRLPACGED